MIPTWAIVLDYTLGTIMWTLIGRAFMNIFQKEDSTFFFKQKTAYEIRLSLVGSEMCIRDSDTRIPTGKAILGKQH